MSFRTRLFGSFVAVVVVPLALLLFGVRAEVGERLSAQFSDRVNAVAAVIRTDFDAESLRLTAQLRSIASDLAGDNRFRLSMHASASRRYQLDYASQAMRRSGLTMLRIQDSTGRILSSGHYRNEYDLVDSLTVRALALAPDSAAFLRVRLAEHDTLVLARAGAVTIGTSRLSLTGGIAVRNVLSGHYSRDPELSVAVRLPGDSPTASSSGQYATSELRYPYVRAADAPALDTAVIVVAQSRAPLVSLQRSVDRWFLAAGAITLALAAGAAAWLSSRVSRPLLDLAEKTAGLDLDRLDVDFTPGSEDEVGILSAMLGQMTGRLRNSMATLREAERRATVGDLARQLNHDVKNGLVPVRNVFRHLAQVAREEPGRLPAILLERQGTIEAGISYLENLAKNYARLSPSLDLHPCDLNGTVTEVVRGSGSGEIRLELADIPAVAADPLVIRRILENLLSNAVDGMNGRRGVVTISTIGSVPGAVTRQPPRTAHRAPAVSGNGGMVTLIVADEGKGMTEAELERAFEDFYTTKPGGTGLGLSIVRRLVLDLNGSLRVETAPGSGTRVIIELPVAP